ncbi:unnamed protein product [Rhizoctonia solani]|uniref:BTB domain-containing protein n=1 Tax=Rhizoctonia solani TaxID=456999 RepID=A0A8H3AUG4_9AGAM|nr:unnamed protein product [Rhizoctonia solani]
MVFTGKTTGNKHNDNPAEVPIAETPQTLSRHPEFCFDNTLIAVQIENTLFNVHRYQLIKSEVFSDMFKMLKPEGDEPEEGSSLDNPIVIKGVAASDFAALLRVLYASLFSSHQPTPDAPLIVPAFRLANMFNFSELRAYLLPLAENSLGDVDKIVFAREFNIKEWLVPAYTRLCQREERLSIEEARKFDVDGVLMISHVREQNPSQKGVPISGSYYCYNRSCGRVVDYGSDARCPGCQSSIDLYRIEPRANGNADNTAIEAEVRQWVEDNYVTKN